MKKTMELIENLFADLDWKYTYNSKNSVIKTGINMNNALGNLDIYILLRKNSYSVLVCLNNHVEKKYLQQVSEYLHRVNFGLNNGNFELDYEDGEIRYKTFVSFENIELSKDIIEDSILLPLAMFEKYGLNLLLLMLQEADPKLLADAADNQSIDE